MDIYTDGACSGNPGPGGWGYTAIENDAIVTEASGSEPETTNNRMELTAVIKALEEVEGDDITIYTDSQYVKNGIEVWIKSWIKRGWTTANKKPVKNRDLWETLHTLSEKRNAKWQWVRGHDGNKYNERADTLATKAVCKAVLF